MKIKHGVSSEIVVFDQMAHDAINANVVINDVINYVGKENFITRGGGIRFLRRFYVIFGIVRLLFDLFNGAKIIHFGHLNKWPLKFLSLLFNNNVYQLQGNAYDFNYSKVMRESKKLIIPYPTGLNVVYFSSDIRNTIFGNVGNDKVVYSFGETRTRRSWVEYINSKTDYYFNTYHKNIDTSKGVIVYILGAIDAYDHKKELFDKTIKSLLSLDCPVPILLKPHVFTELDTVEKFISGDSRFHVTYLHPSILATKAKVFISNNFSNTLADAHSFGVTTVEYAHYDKKRISYAGGDNVSIDDRFVDYFINNDNDKFLEIMRQINSEDYHKNIFNGFEGCDNGLLSALSNNNV
jgi:hypothetical protein